MARGNLQDTRDRGGQLFEHVCECYYSMYNPVYSLVMARPLILYRALANSLYTITFLRKKGLATCDLYNLWSTIVKEL